MRNLKLFFLVFLACSVSIQAIAFCGFYVTKADADLFNESSEVIIVRDGQQTVITMSNDFQGDVEDFAMVVPVPEVLKRDQIRIADQIIFDKLDAYSGPRLVEYHDYNPCESMMLDEVVVTASAGLFDKNRDKEEEAKEDYHVKIEATYTVGEYDILILSAEESGGLERWLKDNGYKIPANAGEVLEPYIKSDLKFFVVKVNLKRNKAKEFTALRPLQMSFRSEKFMLPIRLGMANSKGNQDLIVYAFTRNGRVETSNYRTTEIPTGQNIPEFVEPDFGAFYKSLFDKAWADAGGKSVMLEYAWDLSSSQYVKCDPCVGTPPEYADLREAGVFWVEKARRGISNYEGELFFTRLHVRYNRQDYPQDLMFQTTPNHQRFQGRYVMQRPVNLDELDCEKELLKPYLQQVIGRKEMEMRNFESLTGKEVAASVKKSYLKDYQTKLKKLGADPYIGPLDDEDDGGVGGWWWFGMWGGFMLLMVGALGWMTVRRRELRFTV